MSKHKNKNAIESESPKMDIVNRHQEMKRGNKNVTAEGETSRSVNVRDDVKDSERRHEIHGPDGEQFDSSVEHDSRGGDLERGPGPRGIVET